MDRPNGRTQDAVRLVKQASGPNERARSGRIEGEIEIEIALSGVAEFAEPFSATISGPFQYRKGSALASEVGRPQKISAPQTLAPFAELELALDALGDDQDARRRR